MPRNSPASGAGPSRLVATHAVADRQTPREGLQQPGAPSPAGEEAHPEAEAGRPAEDFSCPLGRLTGIPSAAEIERRFEELIRERWSRGETDWVLVSSNVSVEVELPGVSARSVRARLELRREGGDLRVRIRPGEEKDLRVRIRPGEGRDDE